MPSPPTDISFSGGPVAETARRSVVGTLSVIDPDAGDTHVFTVDDPRFRVTGDTTLRVARGSVFDFETEPTITLNVTATDQTGRSRTEGIIINVRDVNEAPTDIALTSSRVAENSAGAVIGRLSVVDPDTGSTHTFRASDARFEVVGNRLQLKAGVALTAADDGVAVTLTATDAGGLSISEAFAITVADQGTQAVLLTPSTITENVRRVTVGQLSVDNAAPGDVLTFSVSDKRFAVQGDILKMVSNSLDFEATPIYNLVVTVTDQNGDVFTQDVPITVLNVNEAPVFVSGPAVVTLREGFTAVATYQGTDVDAGTDLSYSIIGGTDGVLFTIDADTGALAFGSARDFETRVDFNRDNIYNVTLGVSDGSLVGTLAVQVFVADVQEAGSETLFRRRIDFAPAGAEVGIGFLVDSGKAYNAADGYGWVTEASVADGTANGTIANAIAAHGAVLERPDPTGLVEARLRTYAQFEAKSAPPSSAQHWAWEHALANGTYLVRTTIGDTGGPNDSINVLNIEGVNVLDGFVPSAYLKTVVVSSIATVTDGRLTLDSIGGDNTEIQAVRIEQIRDLTPNDNRPAAADYTFTREAFAVIGGENARLLDRATNVNPNSAFSIGIGNADPNDPVDISSIDSRSVKLIETLTGVLVTGIVNTDAVGGTITFQPTAALKQNTTYTLVVDGVQTESREGLLPGTSSFSTGLNPNGAPTEIAFARQELDVSPETPYSSIALSPDGTYLYATSLAGILTRWEIDPDTGVLRNEQSFTTPALAGRALIGLAFDPEDPNVLWITNNDPLGTANAADFSGKITRVTIGVGAEFTGTAQDYVVGLPRSVRDHLSNSLAFHQTDGEWKLYMTQGSNSATGAPDNSWGNRPERLLTAAVLEIDTDRDVSAGPINVQTQDPSAILPPGAGAQVGWYNPFAANAPVQLYATGVRNGYDLVWHSNGHLYIPANGSAAGGNTPDDPSTPVNEALVGVGAQNDFLFDVRGGFYYGHPNPLRSEYVLNGGNPTAGDDGANEVAGDPRYPGYPVGLTPPADYGGFAYNFSQGRSPNGAVEYLSNAFGGALQNALLVVEYSGGKDIVALRFDAQGRVIDDDSQPFFLADAAGQPLRFGNPLDIVTDALSGRIYVAQLNGEGGTITLLTPTDRDVIPPQDRILEAEDALIAGTRIIVATNQPNYTGTGFVDFRDSSGESITWNFNVAQAGVYRIGFHYALALSDRNVDGRPLTLSVNGLNEATLPFLPNALTFREWDYEYREVALNVGTNSIALTSTGASGANLDHLSISTAPLTALNTAPTIAGTQADLSFTAGTPVAFVLDGLLAADVDPNDVAILQARLVGGAPLPGWLDFDPGTNQFSSNQSEIAAPGIYEIEVVAYDGQEESVTKVVFDIEIVRLVDPADVDADGRRNATDADDDGDGVADVRDPFQADPANGMATLVTEGRRLVFDFDERPFGADPGYALGITGFHLSNGRTPEQLGLGGANLSIGGGVLHIENAGSGDLPTNDLTLGAQFGIDPVARLIRISATFDHPYDTRSPARGANFGLLIGTGDNDNYVKLVLEGKDTSSAFLQMETKIDGVRIASASPSFGRTAGPLYRAADADDTVTFGFDLDTVTGQLTAHWSLRNGADLVTGSAPTITLTGELLAAVQGNHTVLTDAGVAIGSGLSVGVVASSRTAATPIDIDVLDITVEGLVTDPDISLVSSDSPLLGSRAVFSFINRPDENTGVDNPPRLYKDDAVVTIRNDGNDVLRVTSLALDGPFRFLDASDRQPFDVGIGQSRDIEIAFDSRPQVYDPEVAPPLFKGELRVFSDDPDQPVAIAELAGFYQAIPEGGQEPSFNELMEVFGLGTRADEPKFDNFDLYRAAGPDEILSPYWRIADGYGQATVTQLAAYHDISTGAIFLYGPGDGENTNSLLLLTHDSIYNQSVLPLRTNGEMPTITFDATKVPDAWDGDDVFGIRVAGEFSDPRLNNDGPGNNAPPGQRGHFVRFFIAKDEAGNVIADTYVVAQDYSGINYDYQDNLYLVRGITPVDTGPIG